jgi:hypothetical protein
MSKIKHTLHLEVAEAITGIIKTKKLPLECKLDEACGGRQHLPFFLTFRPSRESAVSNVDLMVLKDDKIKLVCEIEESGFNPTKIFGKIFTTASAKVCRLVGKKYIELDDDAVFLQVISNSSFKEDSQKEDQGEIIENEIYHKLKLYNSWIKSYRLIFGNEKDFVKSGRAGYDEIERIIKSL